MSLFILPCTATSRPRLDEVHEASEASFTGASSDISVIAAAGPPVKPTWDLLC